MTLTKIAPRVSAADFKRTKIVATIGPSTNSYEAILKLLKAGVNGIRLNFSHGTYGEREQQIKWVRQASLEVSKPVALIQDLQGPKIGLGDFEGIVPVQVGQALNFRYGADYQREGVLPIQYDLSKIVKHGERLYLFDGQVQTKIIGVKNAIIYTTALNDGVLIARKGINLPDSDFGGDVITAKDRKDLAFASTHDFDYIAQSFIQTAADVERLAKLLKSLNCDAKIIAKIETKAVDNLEAIAAQADSLMVARGDLAIETNLESVPLIQRRIIDLGFKYQRPTIVATQMLASMIDSSQPTRAEVSDIATAVMAGADAVMLSDETANGKYPMEAVQLMKRIITTVQAEEAPSRPVYQTNSSVSVSPQDAISGAIIDLAYDVKAAAIVAETKSGATALKIASHRPNLPIVVATSSQRVAQQLAIMYGAMTFIRKDEQFQAAKLAEWLKTHEVLKKGDIVVTASGQQSGVVGATDTIMVRAL
jgi:pyruvate kinase